MVVAVVSAMKSHNSQSSDNGRVARVSVRSERAARARNRKIESMLKTMQPMRGGLWLAFDRSTGFHWILDAADVRLAPGVRYTGPGTGSVGVVTVRSRSGDAVFQIEEADTLVWDEPERCLRVREGGLRGAEIVLERIGGLDAPLLSEDQFQQQITDEDAVRGISIDRDAYVPIDETFLSSGDPEIDATLTIIESSIQTRGGADGSLTEELLHRMAREIDEIARSPKVRSYVWLTTLRQRISMAAHSVGA
jgi:hypothetical protein